MNKSKLPSKARFYRKIHKQIGLVFVFFIAIISISGLLLALKDPFSLRVYTKETITSTTDLRSLISLARIDSISRDYAVSVLDKSPVIDRIDFRPDKGIAKVLFKEHFTEIQIDGYTGEIISVSTRYDHLIEKIHDGSIIDFLFSDNNLSKYTYSTLLSLALLTMSVSGLLLWYLPKKIRKQKHK